MPAPLTTHRHGFPTSTSRDEAAATAVAAYHELGGTSPTPSVRFVDADNELVVVVSGSQPPATNPTPTQAGPLLIHPGDLPPELFTSVTQALAAKASP